MTTDAYRWSPEGPPPAHEHAWTRVYRKGGRYAHIQELVDEAHPDHPDSWDSDTGWYGTGCQREYDLAASMSLCPRCFVVRITHEI